MFNNLIRTSVRNFIRQPIYSFINISGLVIGLTCGIFIFLWVTDEVQYDRYHPDNDRVFKVMRNESFSDGSVVTDAYSPAVLSATLNAGFPEVEQSCRLRWSDTKLFNAGGKENYEYGDYADKSVFEVFSLPLIEGDIHNALPDLNSIAISRETAIRYFQNEPALGKVFSIGNKIDVRVTAVFENVPDNATEQMNFVLPFDHYLKESGVDEHTWKEDGWLMTFVKLKNRGQQDKIDGFLKTVMKQRIAETKSYLFLLPMTDWRLHSKFENGQPAGGGIYYVVSFTLVAVFILVIACINFMNLSTARSANRSREVGVRKVAGASRGTLILQFMTESILLSFAALVIALMMVHLLLPLFNDFTEKRLSIDYLNPLISGSMIGIALLTGIVSGSYPAFFLSAFRPASVLKGNLQSVFSGADLRRGLVVFQFALSVMIIICAMVVHDQLEYMRAKDLGFDRRNVISINTNPEVWNNYAGFRELLLQSPAIKSVAVGAANPMEINGTETLYWDGKAADDDTYFGNASCDYDYLPTLGFTIVEGRNFSRDITSDSSNFIITEGAAQRMGFAHAVGQRITAGTTEGEIIGVIKDFHNLGIHDAYMPTILWLGKTVDEFGIWAGVYVRYEPGKLEEGLAHIKLTYKKLNPTFPIQYRFLDDSFEDQFRSEQIMGTLSVCFTIMAVLISCLGLFGLALFTAERRTKEIGIRKVLGASVSGLVVLLCRDFVKLVCYAIIIGCPVAWYLMTHFLEKYPYHTELRPSVFVTTSCVLLAMALFIISYQSFKAALANPVDAMRTE